MATVNDSKRKNIGDSLFPDAIPTKRLKESISQVDELCVNTIRCLGAQMPECAKSGHPGAPMGCAAMVQTLFGHVMKYNPADPHWMNRDRFVLSNGHACALQYAMLHLSGYQLSVEDMSNFRQLHSKTPGHPECFATPGVEVCTGPLGQGISNAVGLAIAAHKLIADQPKSCSPLFDLFIYCICGDGCLQEGVSGEASSLAGHLGLGRLIVLYDDNNITIDGSTTLSFTESVSERFAAYGWQVLDVSDASKVDEVISAVKIAKADLRRPSLICCKTLIGHGSKNEGSEKVHGVPLGAEDIARLKQKYGFPTATDFHVPDEVKQFYEAKRAANVKLYHQYNAQFEAMKKSHPAYVAVLQRRIERGISQGVIDSLPTFKPTDKAEATRSLSGKALNAIASQLQEIVGGSADLTGSNCSGLHGASDIQKDDFSGRYIRFGIREHAMAAICNGLFAFGAYRPFAATFLNFITYAWGAVRLSALSQFGVLYIMTHDSIELGEDGPTHQPIETLALLRATPNILTVRPADGNEVSGAYTVWLQNSKRPTVMALCRSGVPHLVGSSALSVLKGAYFLTQSKSDDFTGPRIVLAGSGSEVQICVEAQKLLKADGHKVDVVSVPCWELLAEQPEVYILSLFGTPLERASGKVVSVYVEAASTFGWEKYFNVHVGMSSFGASAPKAALWEEFGFTAPNVRKKTLEFIKQHK